MKRNKNKMCVWLTTMALSFAIAWCSNTKTANNETSVQEGISATETSNKSAVKTSDNTVNSTEVTIATGGNTVGERTSKGLGVFDENGGPGGNSQGGQPPQKPTDASGNELKMPQAPSKESSE